MLYYLLLRHLTFVDKLIPVGSNNNRYFQISWVTYVRFSHFFSVMLVHMSIRYVGNVSHFGFSVCFLIDKKVSHVLVCSSIIYYSKKWIKETVLSLVQKIKLNVQQHLKCWLCWLFGESTMNRTQVQL